MSVKKNRPSREEAADSLIRAMVEELNADVEDGAANAPEIVEDYQAFSDRFSARVIWDRWQNVPPAERVPMILEAYRLSARKDDLPKLTSVRGLTPSESKLEQLTSGMFGGTAEMIAKALRTF